MIENRWAWCQVPGNFVD